MQDKLSEIILPDVLSSYTYWDHFRKTNWCPEQALMLAVLGDAVRCIRDRQSTKSKVRREAVDWILAEENEDLFSFEAICFALGLDASWLRKGILHCQGSATPRRNLAQPSDRKVAISILLNPAETRLRRRSSINQRRRVAAP